MIFAFFSNTSNPAAALLRVLAFRLVTCLHLLRLPCFSLKRIASRLASVSFNFSNGLFSSIIIFTLALLLTITNTLTIVKVGTYFTLPNYFWYFFHK